MFYYSVMGPKDVDGLANNVAPLGSVLGVDIVCPDLSVLM